MNEQSASRMARRQVLRECLADHAAPLTVLSIGLAVGGGQLALAGLQVHAGLMTTIGAMCLVSSVLVAWILDDGDPPQRPTSSEPGEIAAMSDEEFDRLLDEVERQARGPVAPPPPPPLAAQVDDDEFAQLVRAALDELPEFVQDALRAGNLTVIVSDYGSEWDAYGLYWGGTVANGDWHHRIMIFRDTLMAHFGDDPVELRAQVTATVRHEVAHHFGADEGRVRELGL